MAQPRHLLDLLDVRAQVGPNDKAAIHKVRGAWREVTWQQLREAVLHAGCAALRLGVKPGDRVAIFANTRFEWAVADLGIMAAGGAVAAIYSSTPTEEVGYIIQDSGAKLCLVDDDVPDGRQLGRLGRLLAAAPAGLEKIALMEGPTGSDPRVVSWTALTDAAPTAAELAELRSRTEQLRADSLATLLYTSGTTGPPKGVELTHGNWLYQARAIAEVGLLPAKEVVMLFLPLAHSFAKTTTSAWLSLAFALAFAESIEKLVDNCGEVHPTGMPSIPRVFEKIYLKLLADAAAAPGISGRLFRAALASFDDYAEFRAGRRAAPLRYPTLKHLVFPTIRDRLDRRLGGRLRLFVSGGAPLAPKLALFFQELGIEVCEGYGLTETSAGATVNRPGQVKIGTVGPPLPGTEIRIAPDGEVLIRGPGVMRGYHNRPAETREAIGDDRFFHSGDIGELDSEGFLRITDRKKDIIVTAGGSNVAPQNLENGLKTFPIISQAMVHGDRRKFLSALITVNEDEARRILTERGQTAGDYAELSQKGPVREAVDAAIQSVNTKVASHETIKRFAILQRDFTQERGELTPTLKIKRRQITREYSALLDSLYDEQKIA